MTSLPESSLANSQKHLNDPPSELEGEVEPSSSSHQEQDSQRSSKRNRNRNRKNKSSKGTTEEGSSQKSVPGQPNYSASNATSSTTTTGSSSNPNNKPSSSISANEMSSERKQDGDGGQKKRPPRLPETPEVKVSKTLARLLRHQAEKEGLVMRNDGFVKVDDILKHHRIRSLKCDLPMLESIVSADAKNRYSIIAEENPDYDPSSSTSTLVGVGVKSNNSNNKATKPKEILWIRANQGHSVVVQDLELTPIKDPLDLPVCVHGTMKHNWESILRDGLKPMNRTHVHMAIGRIGEKGVISGMRPTSNLLIYIDVPLAISDGIQFFRSQNGVILTSSVLSRKYFEKVIWLDKKGGNGVSDVVLDVPGK